MNDVSQFALLSTAFDSTDNFSKWQSKCDDIITFSLREFLTDYIEAQKWDVSNYQILYNQFLDHAERKINDSTVLRRTLSKDLKTLQSKYKDHGEAFVAAMNDLMATELQWIEDFFMKDHQRFPRIISTNNKIAKLIEEFKKLRSECNAMLTHKERIHAVAMSDKAMAIDELRQLVKTSCEKCRITSDAVTQYVNDILYPPKENCDGHLCSWRQWKNYPAKGKYCGDLNEFELLFTEAYFCVQEYAALCSELTRIITGTFGRQFDEFSEKFQKLGGQLIEKSFVIEENPPHVIKIEKGKHEKFTVVVRCLLAIVWSNATPAISLRYMSGEKARFLKLSGDTPYIKAVENSELPTKHVYKELKLTSEKESSRSKKGINQLYYFAFTISFNQFKTEVHSSVFAICSHTNQIPRLSGEVLWHNAFTPVVDPCTINRNEPDEVSWGEMVKVLNYEFHSEDSVIANCIRPRGGARPQDSAEHFNDNNVRCLADVLRILNEEATMVTFDEFCKELRVKRHGSEKCTFWEWFFACFKTMHEKLREVYERKLLYGFITKEDTEQLLSSTSEDAVLLRFSTQHLSQTYGYITPSRKTDHGNPMHFDSYQTNNLGRVILENELGEKEVDASNLRVVTREDRLEPFITAFQGFMAATGDFIGYTKLSLQRHDGPNPSTPASSMSAYSLSIPQSPQGASSNPSTPQSLLLSLDPNFSSTGQMDDEESMESVEIPVTPELDFASLIDYDGLPAQNDNEWTTLQVPS